VKGAREFYLQVARAMKVPAKRCRELEAEADRIAGQAAPLVADFSGRRLAYNLCSSLDFLLQANVRLGLSEAGFFDELGFTVEILYQGDRRTEQVARVKSRLGELGYHYPVEAFSDTFLLRPLLDQRDYDLVYVADFLVGQVEGAGPGVLELHTLRPGLGAVIDNVHLIRRALTSTAARDQEGHEQP